MTNDTTVVIRGAGDLATGIGHRLHRSGFKVLHVDLKKPLVIRRTITFTQAIFNGEGEVEGVKCVKANNLSDIYTAWKNDSVPVMVDSNCDILKELKPDVLVDAIMAKKNLGTNRNMAPITIAIGPGFTAPYDVDIVIESNRGHYLGRLILDGSAEPNTGTPGLIVGYGKERVIHSPARGIIRNLRDIGAEVKEDETLAYIEESSVPIRATLDGTLRGLINDGTEVFKGLKVADIDPRAKLDHCFTITDKARSIGGAVLEGILYMKKIRKV